MFGAQAKQRRGGDRGGVGSFAWRRGGWWNVGERWGGPEVSWDMQIFAGDWGAMGGVRAGRMAEKAFPFCRAELGEGTAAAWSWLA